MACCRKNATPVFLLLLVVFIFHFDLTHPAAVINEFAGSGRPVVLPTAGAPNAHPPKDEASSSGAGDGDGDVSVADEDSGARPEKAPCVNCEHQRSMDALRKTHGENELVQIRLEVIKEQILAKLRMTSPPSVHFPRTKLPLPLLYPQGEIMQNDHPSHSDPGEHDSGRFYGEPKQLIVFGKQVHNCTERRRSACLVFEMPHDVEVEDVTSAELWLYKYRSDGLGKQVFVVSEVSRGSSRHGKAAVATTLHERRVTNQRGWVKFNMRSVVRHWVKTARRDDGVVQVTCRTCRKLRHHRQSAPIEINGENRPIIVINIGARRQRTKRSASDCRFGCCMEHFYVNFTEIGWNDWIIQPKGYVANHCTGSCTAMSRSNIQPQKSHSAVIYQLDANRREPAITACCAPSRMSSISIIYHNNDGLIVNSQLPDMVVDECKCFF